MNTQKKVLGAMLAASLLTSALVTTAVAQPADTATADRTTATDRDDDGFDWGLLGLLGLLGLIPRKRHDNNVRHDTTRTTAR